MKINESLTERRQKFKQELFLKHFRKWGIITPSAEAAGIARQLVYYWKKTCPSFAKLMLEAENESRKFIADLVLSNISKMARGGDRKIKKLIRDDYGELNYKAVISGKNLTWKDIRK